MVCIVLACVVGVFCLMCAVFLGVLNLHTIQQADRMTQIICENNGSVPDFEEYKKRMEEQKDLYLIGFNEESAYRTRYFIVYLDEKEKPQSADTEHIASVSAEESLRMSRFVLKSGREVGTAGIYRYRISYKEDGEPGYIVFLDYSQDKTTRNIYVALMGIIFVAFALLIVIIFGICSKYVLRPFEENSRRQKQFITDASHELKTPLAIISANAEVLEFKDGKNEWTQAIRSETKHMGKLIGDLLVLSKLQEVEDTLSIEPVDFGTLVLEEAEKFREVITQKGCDLQLTMQPDVKLNGNPEHLARLVGILVENAAKYVKEGGMVCVEAHAKGRIVSLQIFNTADIEDEIDCSRMFERFYRTDKSRTSSTGGHGIGLSIAQRIVDCHRGRIGAEKKGDGILFTVTLPADLRCNV